MRVGFGLEQCLAPVPGGTGRYSVEVARALEVTARAGDTVSGWTAWHRDLAPARRAGVGPVHRLPLGRRALAAAWERGLGPTPRGVDLVHAPTVLAPPRRGRPLVVTVHDAVPWTHPETLTGRGIAFHRRMGKRIAATADLIVVPSRAVAVDLGRFLPLRAVEVVPLGVSADLAPPPDADARADALRLPPDGYLLTVSTFEPRKGLDVLLDALALPPAPRLSLLVAGRPGWGDVDPADEAARRGLSGRVRLVPTPSDPDLAVLISRATAVVVPSRAEGFGLPVLEAMALGTPVVTSDAPALVEVGGEATRRAPVGDPMALAETLAAVVGDPAARDGMSVAGRRRAALFSWQAAAERLWEGYRRLVGQ